MAIDTAVATMYQHQRLYHSSNRDLEGGVRTWTQIHSSSADREDLRTNFYITAIYNNVLYCVIG